MGKIYIYNHMKIYKSLFLDFVRAVWWLNSGNKTWGMLCYYVVCSRNKKSKTSLFSHFFKESTPEKNTQWVLDLWCACMCADMKHGRLHDSNKMCTRKDKTERIKKSYSHILSSSSDSMWEHNIRYKMHTCTRK